MEVGVHLPQVGTSDARRVHDVVDAARDLGLAAVCANDHLAFHLPWLDGPTLLSAVADHARPLELATTVALPSLRGPVQLGAALMTLATLAPGRVVAGVGVGSSAVDHALAGVPYEERWSRFEESVRVLRTLLRGDPPPAAWADRLAASGATAASTSVPVWVASWGSPAGLRRVARLGDGWLASAYNTTPEQFATCRVALSHELTRGPREATSLPAAVATMWTWIDDDRASAERVLSDLVAPLVRRAPADLRDRVCIGPAEHCAALLSDYAAAGCSRVYVWPVRDEVSQLRRLVDEVLPLVRS